MLAPAALLCRWVSLQLLWASCGSVLDELNVTHTGLQGLYQLNPSNTWYMPYPGSPFQVLLLLQLL